MRHQEPPGATKRRSTDPLGKAQPVAQPVSAALVPQALLTWRTFIALSGVPETSLRRCKTIDPAFPAPVRVGRAGVRFRASEVTAWLDQRNRIPTP
jgi:predicted DNA-binding transcriptional regulator AlpA